MVDQNLLFLSQALSPYASTGQTIGRQLDAYATASLAAEEERRKQGEAQLNRQKLLAGILEGQQSYRVNQRNAQSTEDSNDLAALKYLQEQQANKAFVDSLRPENQALGAVLPQAAIDRDRPRPMNESEATNAAIAAGNLDVNEKEYALALSNAARDRAAQSADEKRKQAAEKRAQEENDRKAVAAMREAQGYKDTVQKVYDPKSATGWSYANGPPEVKGQAAPAPGGNEFAIEFDETGKPIRFSAGNPGARKPVDPLALQQSVITGLQNDMVNSGERKLRILDLLGTVKPEYLRLSTTYINELTKFREKTADAWWGGPSEEQLEFLDEVQDFKQKAFSDVNEVLRDMSGLVITPQEYERLIREVGDPQTGLLTGDSYTTYVRNLKNVYDKIQLAEARARWILKNPKEALEAGYTPKTPGDWGGFSLYRMEKIIDEFGNKMESELKKQNPNATPQQVEAEVGRVIAREFYGQGE